MYLIQRTTSAWQMPALVTGFIMMLSALPAQANDNQEDKKQSKLQPNEQMTAISMSVSPNQCIAMTEGQTCYVDIELTWRSQSAGNFCLYSSLQDKAVKCWTNKTAGSYEQEIASKQNVLYSLHRQDDLEVLAESEVEMAWIHKKRGKPTNWWRLF